MDKKKEDLVLQVERLKTIRKKIDMNRKEFSVYMGIPLRTLEEWEAGRRKMPDYVLRLIEYKVKVEKYMQENGLGFLAEEIE